MRVSALSLSLRALLLALACLAPSAQAADRSPLADFDFGAWVEARDRERTGYGISVIDLVTGETHESFHNADVEHFPASTIKTLVAFAALRKVDRGELALGQAVRIDQPNADQDNVRQDRALGSGRSFTVLELLKLALGPSSNIATNQLVDLAGKEFINSTAQEMKAEGLRFNRKVYNQVPAEPDNPLRNVATVRGLMRLYHEILTGERGLLRAEGRELLARLLRQDRRHRGNRSMNLAHHFPLGVPFHHKTGTTSDSTSDAGFVYSADGKKAVILVGLQAIPGRVPGKAPGGHALLRKMGKMAYEKVIHPLRRAR